MISVICWKVLMIFSYNSSDIICKEIHEVVDAVF